MPSQNGFLMHRVELKVPHKKHLFSSQIHSPFLMHRVELKEIRCETFLLCLFVPNAPCGVESSSQIRYPRICGLVPNAPCGVERWLAGMRDCMQPIVPNAPGGVERQ